MNVIKKKGIIEIKLRAPEKIILTLSKPIT